MLNQSLDDELAVADLLVLSGFLDPYNLDRALANKREHSASLQDILLTSGWVTPRHYQCANEVRAQATQCRLSSKDALAAMYMVGNCGMSVDEAFNKLGFRQSSNPWANQLTILTQSKKWDSAS